MVLTVQWEVAERILAVPGEMNLLALGVQAYGEARIMSRLTAASFYPSPRVDSAVLRIDLRPARLGPRGEGERGEHLSRRGSGILPGAVLAWTRWGPCSTRLRGK